MRLVDITHFAGRITARLPRGMQQRLRALARRLPLRLNLSAPVMQAYVNDAHTRSYVGIHNFYSVLVPNETTDARADIELRNERGDVVLRHRQDIAHGGATMIDIARLFDSHGVKSMLGVITVQLTPRHPRRVHYRDLGLVTSHFFVHFEDENGSVGQIHPLSTADVSNQAGGHFKSSQLITTAGLTTLEGIQYNAMREPRRVRHYLTRVDNGEVVAAKTLAIAPLGAAISRFSADEFAGHTVLGFVVDDLPAPNAKPVLRRTYANGLYSVSHA